MSSGPREHDRVEVGEPLDGALRGALAELEEFLDQDVADERLAELVLPFASRWALPGVGLDLGRLRREADVFVRATPEWDRILAGYSEQVGYWVSQRMLLDERDEPRPEVARAFLDSARAEIGRRARLLETAGFPRVAGAFRRLLEETAGGSPPTDRLWRALALRIAESVL